MDIVTQKPAYIHTVRTAPEWEEEVRAHEARLRPVVEPHLRRHSLGEKHPVLDFLFEYYAFRPAHLMRWSPGFGVALAGPSAERFLDRPGFVRTEAGVALDPAHYPPRRLRALQWIRDLLQATASRPPFFGCHGLHEWAMVYRAGRSWRHPRYPLRLSAEALAAFVEAGPVVCTHFDAFRFFTPEARPLNRIQPSFEAMPALEQPGCLHTNMDLYRWAFKLYPWVPGALIADAFLLAARIREVDMRASPYDLRGLGYAPIPIEAPGGRRDYRSYQQQFAEAAAPLRARLLDHCEALLAHTSPAR